MSGDLAPRPLPSLPALREALDYDPDTGTLIWKHRSTMPPNWNGRYAGCVAGCKARDGVRISLGKVIYTAHRIAWALHHGAEPPALIDHVNGDPHDNRIANLRAASKAQNAWNCRRPASNRSGVKGVCWDRTAGKWLATIKVAGRQRYIGRFATIDAAALAYAKAADHFFGQYARAA